MLGVSRPPDPGWEAAAQTPCICGAFPNPRGPSPIRRPAGAVRSANPECPKVMPSYSPTCALKIIYTHLPNTYCPRGPGRDRPKPSICKEKWPPGPHPDRRQRQKNKRIHMVRQLGDVSPWWPGTNRSVFYILGGWICLNWEAVDPDVPCSFFLPWQASAVAGQYPPIEFLREDRDHIHEHGRLTWARLSP
jgi:hypothetical protein